MDFLSNTRDSTQSVGARPWGEDEKQHGATSQLIHQPKSPFHAGTVIAIDRKVGTEKDSQNLLSQSCIAAT